jgi:response regulator RpfG family c-di-GMP phosphodiesterase
LVSNTVRESDEQDNDNQNSRPNWYRINQNLVVAMLKRLGHSSTLVETGLQAAVEVAQKNSYDLVLMDVQMPDMDGIGQLMIPEGMVGFEKPCLCSA